MANYDSAIADYKNFIDVSNDSLLVPKAYYALYYIYTYERENQAKADSFRQIILQDFPTTPYAAYFSAKNSKEIIVEEEISPYKYLFLQGEALLYDGRYEEAIDVFTQIAVEDSGSEVAKKARYASAWIYEKKLDDIPDAVHAYTMLAREYPQSEAGKLAQKKISEPVADVLPDASVSDSLQSVSDSLGQKTKTENSAVTAPFKLGPPLRKSDKQSLRHRKQFLIHLIDSMKRFIPLILILTFPGYEVLFTECTLFFLSPGSFHFPNSHSGR